MNVEDVMSRNPDCCTVDTGLQEVARRMVDCDCGEIPVVDSSGKPVGVLTDRDICCRTVAQGRNPLDMKAGDVMTTPVATVTPQTSVSDCCKLMEARQIRRVVVVDDAGRCCGIVAQADIALHDRSKREVAQVLEKISAPQHA
jgi:CBS domain-containing protein